MNQRSVRERRILRERRVVKLKDIRPFMKLRGARAHVRESRFDEILEVLWMRELDVWAGYYANMYRGVVASMNERLSDVLPEGVSFAVDTPQNGGHMQGITGYTFIFDEVPPFEADS